MAPLGIKSCDAYTSKSGLGRFELPTSCLLGRRLPLSNSLPRTSFRFLHPDTDDVHPKSPAAQKCMKPPAGPLTFVRSVRAGQALDQGCTLTVEPTPSSGTSQGPFRRFFVAEGLVDGFVRDLSGHSLLAQFLGQTKASPRLEADPAAHVCRSEGMVIDEPLFLEGTEAPLHERMRKIFGTETAPKFLLGSRSVREKMKGGLANTPLGIVFLQLGEILCGQVAPDVDAGALHDVQSDLERLGALQMQEDTVLLAPHELDAEDF